MVNKIRRCLKTHASILSDVSVDPFTSNDSNVEVAAMSCVEIDSDDESDDDRCCNVNFIFCWFVYRSTIMRKICYCF